MFRKMPILLLALCGLVILMCPFLSHDVRGWLYGLSLSFKSVITFFLPVVVFGLLFKTAVGLAKQATAWLVWVLVAICVSNFISTLWSYGLGHLAYQGSLGAGILEPQDPLMPLGVFSLPQFLNNSQAMLGGLVLGILGGFIIPERAGKIGQILERFVGWILKLFVYIIPPFIVGFIVKMVHEKILTQMVFQYGPVFGLIALALLFYITMVYWISSGFDFKKTLRALKNMVPATMAGFGSMSSAAAMPLTLLGTQKNGERDSCASSIIPLTVNVHLIGDCFAIPIFAFAIMKSFGMEAPSAIQYLQFSAYFVLAKFSVAAVPGGGIVVMLPLLERYLGFTTPMLSLITTLYILFDPLITSANVLGNGGFALGLARLLRKKNFAYKPRVEQG